MMKIDASPQDLCMNCLDFEATWEFQESQDFCPGATFYQTFTTFYTCSTCGVTHV